MGGLVSTALSVFADGFALLCPDILYLVKWVVSYVCIYIERKQSTKRFDLYDIDALHDPEKVGFLVPKIEKKLESPLEESLLGRNADGVFFYGVNDTGDCLAIRVSRNCNQKSQATIHFKDAGGKIYSLPENAPNYQQPPGSEPHAFSCGGLKVYYLVPMRSWRIFYSGFLREQSSNLDEESIVYGKFTFLWKASSDIFNSLSDISISELATALSAENWKSFTPPLKRLQDMLDFYSQVGTLSGTIQINENPEEEKILYGERLRFIGDLADMEGVELFHLSGYNPNGKMMHIGRISIPGILQKLHFGFVVNYQRQLFAVDNVEIKMDGEGNYDRWELKFTAGQQYKITASLETTPSLQIEELNGSFFLYPADIDFGKHGRGKGLVLTGITGKIHHEHVNVAPITLVPEVPPLVVKFTDPLCNLELVGGKGCSLAKLTAMSNEQFSVPKGFVVTTAAYWKFISEDLRTIKYLEGVTYGSIPGNLKEECERISRKLAEKDLPRELREAIESSLLSMLPEDLNSFSFAVRSSSTVEDSESTSGAGQMETFLGVQGVTEVLTAVTKCWASQFKFTPNTYKHLNGLPVNSPMAVVIQEMVPCDVAGVVLTCDPLTGNSSKIVITASRGQGESVVSAKVDPDTVFFKRDHRNELILEHYEVGVKTKTTDEAEGTTEKSSEETVKQSRCLPDQTAFNLVEVALFVEQNNRCPQDIEWGVKNNEIYLVQARPVPKFSTESDFEIFHEFDSPMRCGKEYFTTANVGEVMPGATSPLGSDLIKKFMTLCYETKDHRQLIGQQHLSPKYFSSGFYQFCNHFMLNLFMAFPDAMEEGASIRTRSLMVGLFGRTLNDPALFAAAKELLSDHEKPRSSNKLFLLRLYLFGLRLSKAREHFKNYTLPEIEKCSNSQQAFDKLMYRCTDLTKVFHNQMSSTLFSSACNELLRSVLLSRAGFEEIDAYRDLAALLASCSGVESVDVPETIKKLASCIDEEIGLEEFQRMTLEDALKWLKSSRGVSGSKFQEFLSRHGHRSLKEIDVHTSTWSMDPKPVVQMLQVFQRSTRDDSENTLEKIRLVSRLSSSSSLFSRLKLAILVPVCRRGVRQRELAKSLVIKGVDGWRKGYRRLGELLVQEGRIPDIDLFFFLTVDELQEVIKAPSPRLISKAFNRRRLKPEMERYNFPEIMKGVPKPISHAEPQVETGDLTMTGTPMSLGVVRGRARVAMTTEEAASLQTGEILITHSVDIGWSIYFRDIVGLATELGGLLSHGATIAREYSLPCVIGLHGATELFKTGDFVLLDAYRGILSKTNQE